MITLNIVRNEDLISSVKNSVKELYNKTTVCPELCRGVLPENSDAVTDAFELIQKVYEKRIKNTVSIQQLVFEKNTSLDAVKDITNEYIKELGNRHQIVTGVSRDDSGCYTSTIIINPVSYLGGNNFYDKNSSYKDLLNNLSDHNIKLGVKNGVLFDNDNLMDSYTNDRL